MRNLRLLSFNRGRGFITQKSESMSQSPVLSFTSSQFEEPLDPSRPITMDLDYAGMPALREQEDVVQVALTSDDDDVVIVEQPDQGRKCGRSTSTVWILFTNDDNPQNAKRAKCKHCNTLVNHHKKSESAMTHLNNCSKFRTLMNGLEDADRPDWFKRNKRPGATSGVGGAKKRQASSSGQSSIKSYALPKMSTSAKQAFQKQIALHYFATGTPFQRIGDVHLKEAIKMLRPDDGLLPTRAQLATSLLDKCHEELKAKVDARMNGSTTCLTTDGWSNIKSDAVVNYMAVSPDSCLYLEAVQTGQQGHDHEFIANDVERVFKMYDKTTFAGTVMDNTSANKKAWAVLHNKFPSRFFQGCTSHGLHLFVKDIFCATKTKKAGDDTATYPVGYPFEEMLLFINECKDIVKFFHNHHVVKAQLQELQKTSGARSLVRPCPTRWGTIGQTCQTLLASEKHLHTIVSARDFIKGTAAEKKERTDVKETITDSRFVDLLKKAIAILEPLDTLTVKYQSDKVPISEVVPDFHKLPQQFAKLLSAKIINEDELAYLSNKAASRFQFMYGHAHGLAYMLDPRFIAEGLPREKREELEDILFGFPVDDEPRESIDEARAKIIFNQYTEFVIAATKEKELDTMRYTMLSKGHKTVLQYWLVDGKDWPELRKIAIKLFSMATSSAASERNWSTMGFVHSKLRNALTPKNVDKLVFIKSNLPAFYDYDMQQDVADECDDCSTE